ncbi:Undecaprenyl-phosphate mannosyltransferase [Crateriforma conspicua]|uniref:Undecaprenyl-phosphate mannosyltransferase n=2 Tax=Crateriforma TaxID=2714592 RepID=A0A5C6FWK0_9PLAN|nr:glycosyltransferase family 2 protein [Crateriforma conspicua]TWU66756.1 Undecaprenyl-phosphate mannosyltransferase [Crateriforma conspicua]
MHSRPMDNGPMGNRLSALDVDAPHVFDDLDTDTLVVDPDQMLQRIDDAMDLIAQANCIAQDTEAVDQYDVTVVVPVYNERDSLPEVLDRLDQVMPPATEIVVIDDASTDGTTDWLKALPQRRNRRVLFRRRNHGKGSAVRLGIRHSRGKVVAIQDADLEYDPADLLRVIWPVLEGKADAVYGSRYLDSRNKDHFLHRLGNGTLTAISNRLTGLKLTDMETCHKAFRGEFLRSIALKECRFGFEPEITAKVAALGGQVIEVPTTYTARGYDEGKKIGWRDAVSALRCMWRYRRG